MANVFGALNRFISRLDSDPSFNSSATGGAPGGPKSTPSNAWGFQVLQNTNVDISLDPWFDFIIGVNSHNIDSPDPHLFVTEVRNCAGSTISLGVYSAKGQQIREVYLSVPTAASDPAYALGLVLQWSPLSAAEAIWHILDVMPNSPADVAGVLPYSDFVIGSPERASLRGDTGLGELVEAFIDRPLRLFVYNQEYDVTRLVTITPARNWGGDGALGCVLGFGALHRIPAPLTEPAQAPGETLFDAASPNEPVSLAAQPRHYDASASQSTDFMVPANLQFDSNAPLNHNQALLPPTSLNTGPPPAGKPRKPRPHHGAATELDEYFAEAEKKSREVHFSPSSAKPGLPPPPSKSGGPPKAESPAPLPINSEEKALNPEENVQVTDS